MVKLPFEFKGVWISEGFGGFQPPIRERFLPEMPRDALHDALIKGAKESKDEREKAMLPIWEKEPPHKYAKPTWISRETLEEQYGKVIYVDVELLAAKSMSEEEQWGNYSFGNFTIWTENFVLLYDEYDGAESLRAVHRNPPGFLAKMIK